MPRRKLAFGAIVTLVGLMAVVVIGQRGRWADSADRGGPSSIAPALEAVRLNPPSDTCAEVECASLDFISFAYEIFNRGQAPITGLKLGTKCGCEDVGAPPEAIPPGASGMVRFRVRAPRAGRLERKIPLLADGSTEPLLVLDASLHVKVDPPVLVAPPGGLSFTFVAGKTSTRDLVVEAIEVRQDERWIRGADVEPADGLDVRPPEVQDLPEADPTLTLRRYRFALANRSFAVGRHAATMTLRTRTGAPPIPDQLVLLIEIADPVVLVPNPLVVRYTPGSPAHPRRVCVIDRTGGQATASVGQYDQDLLRVEAAGPRGASTAAFDVVPVQTPDGPLATKIVFQIGDGQTRELAVRFEPSKRPSRGRAIHFPSSGHVEHSSR